MKIIDAHQHFWDLDANYLPWLSDHPVAFRYGDYSALKRNYLPPDYLEDVRPYEVVGSVFIETEWDPRDPLGEVAWVAALRERHGLPSVMVAQAWLDRPDAPDVLAAHGATPFVRGIRHKPRSAPSPDRAETGAPGSMSDPAWRAGYALLARNELSFDLQAPWWHLAEARRLADDFPDTTMILNHTGLPADRSPAGIAGWREALRGLAGARNVVLKISGLGQRDSAWTQDANRGVVLDAIGIFEPERVMFASNFPVDSLVAGFRTIYDAFDAITSGFSERERTAMFMANAARIYQITGVAT
jgi:predicted TIM-barrel fold metal-dependent hydrolase